MTGHIIGLTGYAQTGKDTIATYLAGHGYRRLAFADALRDTLYALNPVVGYNAGLTRLTDVVDCNGWERAKRWPEVRRLLQQIGSEVVNRFDGRTALIAMVVSQIRPDRFYVITDVRFPDEAHAIREAGGVIWRVDRPGVGPINDHISEHALDGFEPDAVLLNDGGYAMLEMRVVDLMRELDAD